MLAGSGGKFCSGARLLADRGFLCLALVGEGRGLEFLFVAFIGFGEKRWWGRRLGPRPDSWWRRSRACMVSTQSTLCVATGTIGGEGHHEPGGATQRAASEQSHSCVEMLQGFDC